MGIESLIRRYFPYQEFRKWQWEIAKTIYDALSTGKVALIEAPTGVGKTASALAASLAYAEEVNGKVLFLVKTKNEAQAPIRELSKLRERGLDVNYVVIRNRPDMCCIASSRRLPYEEFLEECRLLRNRGECEYYVNSKKVDLGNVMEMVLENSLNVSSYVKNLCSLTVCPYEVSREYLLRSRVGIMTYYYVFSLNKPETVDVDLEGSILLIDEAHNLPESISSLNSVSLSSVTINMAIAEVKRFIDDEELKARTLKILKGLQAYITKLSNLLENETTVSLELGDVLQFFEEFQTVIDSYYEIIRRKRLGGVAIPYTPLSKVLEFHKALLSKASGFGLFLTRDEQGISLLHRCIDPSIVSGPILNKAGGLVLMSGTLPPRDYIISMLGLTRNIEEFRIGFRDYVNSGNYEVYVLDTVTTRYVERDEEEFSRIANALSQIYINYNIDKAILAIFPSYAVLKSVRKYLPQGINYVMELGTTSVDDIINKLKASKKTLIMAVAGGKLVEGVEYRLGSENLLGMVIIVGVPYPEPSDYLDAVIDILAARLSDRKTAWELTYQWPAIVRVKQAVGRAFRSEGDKAIIILMDRRFRDARLHKVFSEYFGKYEVISDIDTLISKIRL